MGSYPNPRVNKRERDEALFSSLGGKTIDTSALAVEEPDMAEKLNLYGSDSIQPDDTSIKRRAPAHPIYESPPSPMAGDISSIAAIGGPYIKGFAQPPMEMGELPPETPSLSVDRRSRGFTLPPFARAETNDVDNAHRVWYDLPPMSYPNDPAFGGPKQHYIGASDNYSSRKEFHSPDKYGMTSAIRHEAVPGYPSAKELADADVAAKAKASDAMAGIRNTVAGIEADQARRERDPAHPLKVGGVENPDAIAAGVQSDYSAAKLPQFYGYKSGTLAPADEQRLADMGQPGLAHGPYNDPRTSQRWANLRASMPQKASREAPAMRPEMIEANKAREAIRNGTTHELTEGQLKQGRSVNEAGAANLAAGEAARSNVSHNAQMEALMRRSRLAGAPVSPLQASLFVGSGLGRPAAPQATTMVNDGVANAGAVPQPMNPHMKALFPQLAAEEMRTGALGEAARAKNAVDMRTADSTEKTQKIQAISALQQIDDADFDRKISLALDYKERMRLQDEKLANRRMRQNQIAQLVGIDSSMPTSSVADGSPTRASGVPVIPADNAPPPVTAPTGAFPTPRDNSPEALLQAANGFQPNFADLWAAAPFAEQKLGPLHSDLYKPGIGSFDDSNKNGQWDQGEVFTTPEAGRYYHGQANAKRIVDEMMQAIESSGVSGNARAANQLLMSRFGSQYGPDAVRWVLAKRWNRPEWIDDYSTFANDIANPPPTYQSYGALPDLGGMVRSLLP